LNTFRCFCTHEALVTAVPFGYTLLTSPVKPEAPVTIETLVCVTVYNGLFEHLANICDTFCHRITIGFFIIESDSTYCFVQDVHRCCTICEKYV